MHLFPILIVDLDNNERRVDNCIYVVLFCFWTRQYTCFKHIHNVSTTNSNFHVIQE